MNQMESVEFALEGFAILIDESILHVNETIAILGIVPIFEQGGPE